jgi:hypothetical protein
MKSAIRIAFIATFVAGLSFAVPHAVFAQNTDDAHALCAQGGGDSSSSGAGGSDLGAADTSDAGANAASLGSADSLGDSQAADADPESGASGGAGGNGGGEGGGLGNGNDATFSHAASNDAGSGQGGSGAGLGGGDAGGGAGGCGPDITEATPVFVRRLPVTGGPSDRVGYMGAGFVLVGLLLAGTKWRLNRRGAATPDGLVWDAFGTPTN